MSFFVAVDLDAQVRAQVAALIDAERAALPASWLRFDKLHVTLQFLGHPQPEALAELEPLLGALAARHRPFRLRLAGAGLFETRRAPAVLWLGVQGALEALAALQREVAAAAGATDDKPFVPHLTLARGRQARPLEDLAQRLADFTAPEFEVAALVLYESRDQVYRRVYEVALTGP